MVRLLGLNLPDNKKIDYALTLFFGIGWKSAADILKESGVDKNKKVSQLSEDELKQITTAIEKKYQIEGELREGVNEDIKRLKDIGAYRGLRHTKGLPVHGQRTRSNARTKRGKRKTVGALRKEMRSRMEQQSPTTPAS